MPSIALSLLAPAGSTGNNTHAGVGVGAAMDKVAVQFVVEAIGATPTVTWKVQGTLDGVTWNDLFYVTPSTNTAASTAIVATTVSTIPIWLDQAGAERFYSQLRLVTSANTNVTYRAEMYIQTRS
jgi:hypothetical protein